MISSSSLTELASADLASSNGSGSNFNWFSTSLAYEAAPLLADSAAAPDSFQNVFAQVSSSSAPDQSTSTFSADHSESNTAVPTSIANGPGPAVSSGPAASSGPTAGSSAIAGGSTASASAQNVDRSNHKSSVRGVLPQTVKLALLRSASISASSTSPNPGAHPNQNPNASPASPSVATSDQTAGPPSPAGDEKNALSSSGTPQNALPAAAANALGGLKNLPGAAFALHITVGSNQAHAAPGAATPASAGQSGAGQTLQSQTAQSQTPQNQTSQNQTGQNQDGQNQPASDAGPGATTPFPANAADPQAILQTSTLAELPAPALNMGTPSAAAPTAQPSPSAALAASTATGEIAAEDPTGAPQTVRSVQVQLAGEGEGRVDLRLVEHAGGLSVSVRASDSALTKGLQDNLPELSARLAEDKYQTHTFLPAANETGGSASSSSEQSSGQATEDQASGRSFSQGGGQAGGQPGGQTDGQSNGGEPSDSGSAWRRQMAALGALSSVSKSLPGSQSQTTNS